MSVRRIEGSPPKRGRSLLAGVSFAATTVAYACTPPSMPTASCVASAVEAAPAPARAESGPDGGGDDALSTGLRRASVDFGDGPIAVAWNDAGRTLTVGAMPPISIDDPRPFSCWHVTGYAASGEREPTILVVVSVLFGPHSCGTMLGHSLVYRFAGNHWTHLVDTAGSELHLRSNGSDVIEWKLQSAESSVDDGPWSRCSWTTFPPKAPRVTDVKTYGFMPPAVP